MRSERNNSIIRNLDWWTIGLAYLIVLFGWVNIYGANFNFEQTSMFSLSNRAGKQFLWIVITTMVGIGLLFVKSDVYDVMAYILYGLMVTVLVITPFISNDTKGSLSWIDLGHGIKLQPAEFAKFITALAVAKCMGRYGYKVRDWRDLLMPMALIALPALIIMVPQKETGSALVFSAFLLVFYREGMSGYVLAVLVAIASLSIVCIRFGAVPLPLGTGSVGMLVCLLLLIAVVLFFIYRENKRWKELLILCGVVVGVFGMALLASIWAQVPFCYVAVALLAGLMVYSALVAWYLRHKKLFWVAAFALVGLATTLGCDFVFTQVLQPHQRVRIEVLLGLKDDPKGAGYNVNQARIAIGSGGVAGKGFLQGTQTKLQFVPEQSTDFIFCTVGEEWGFLGSAGLLLVYLAFILRLVFIAERQRDTFSRVYAYSVASIFLFHLTINIGMVLGLLPVIGIPLPFFSYGGSSLLGFTIMLAILLRMDVDRLDKQY